jgi:hypothetical protein
VRLFMFAGLKGLDFNSRYLAFLRARLFERMVIEIRAANGLDETAPVSEEEIELIWSLHAGIFYIGVRKFIYGMPIPADPEADIDVKVNAFLNGAPTAFAAVIGRAKPVRRKATPRK